MDLTLSTKDVDRLSAIFTAAVSPLSYPSIEEWRTTVRAQLVELLDADRSVSQLHVEGEAPLEVPIGLEAAIIAYAEYYHRLDTGLSQRRRELGLEVIALADIYDVEALQHTELYHDWLERHCLHDALAVAVDVPGATDPAGFWFYHERRDSPPFGDRGKGLLKLLLPAVKSGMLSLHRFAAHRGQLLTMLDTLPDAVLVATGAGCVLHENRALTELLASEPDRLRVRAEMVRTAQLLASVVERRRGGETDASLVSGSPAREIRTAGSSFRVVASWLGAGLLAPAGVALVMLEGTRAAPTGVTSLRQRYGLTAREVEVLGHVRNGLSALEIAQHLGISCHTARHHVEALRTKLGVHRVGHVAAMLSAISVER